MLRIGASPDAICARAGADKGVQLEQNSKDIIRRGLPAERGRRVRADARCDPARYRRSDTARGPFRAGDARRKKNRVIFTGTLTPKKGVISLIKAWPHVLKQDSSAELHLFGKDGRTDCGQGMQEYLSSLLSSEDRASVNFHGHVSRGKITEELLQSGIAVFPSLAEGFANSPLEAMACGCATIYSRPGSGAELIDDSRNGLLVDPNCPMAISDAIVRLLRDDELRDRLGEAGRRHVRARFSTEKILAKESERSSD